MRMSGGMTRREALRTMAVAGAGVAGLGTVDDLVSRAVAASPKHGTLADIEHVVILIQENRSFDHYFGMYPGVRGFGDKKGASAFVQKGQDGKTVTPFHFDTGCMADLTHDWGPQHQAFNHGKMDRFLAAHQAADAPINGVTPAAETMGYYDGKDLPFYYALADKFTLCDGYHCSVIGPTDPNRLMSMSATLDPAGAHGGPLVETLVGTRADKQGTFTWRTMPEQLSAKGVSWKVYTGAPAGVLDSVLPYFKAYHKGSKLYDRGLAPTYPADFMADLSSGTLPKVSWILLGLTASEHPDFSSPAAGEAGAQAVVEALVSHPDVWRKTAMFLTWDENGGFFDHVAPPAAPAGTPGEYLTVGTLPVAAQGVRGPIGLGFRVPMLVVSPFSRGGLVSSDTFDHTSTLRFLETRFRVKVPNLSAWRRKATGDLTSAFNFAAKPNPARPALAGPGSSTCSQYLPVTASQQPFPKQPKAKRRRPSGIV